MSDPKGVNLEREFEEWMKAKLGYKETERRVPVKGQIADRPYEVDIHGVRFSLKWKMFQGLGLYVMVLGLLMLILPSLDPRLHEWMENFVGSIFPRLAGYGALVFGFAGWVISRIGKQRTITHTWVECKDRKGNVKRAHVQKLNTTVQDVINNRPPKWDPIEVIIVSGTDFDVDALNFAREYGYSCYRRSANGFERVLGGYSTTGSSVRLS